MAEHNWLRGFRDREASEPESKINQFPTDRTQAVISKSR
jgi:hypothetical protein